MNRNRLRSEGKVRGLGQGVGVAAALIVAVGIGAIASGCGDSSTTRRAEARRATSRHEMQVAPPADEVATTSPVAQAPVPAPFESREPATWTEAQAAWDAGQWGVAAERFASYTDAHERNAWGWFMTGLALRQDGRFAEAEPALVHCLEIDPNHVKGLVALARVRLSLDRAGDALDPVEAAVDRDPENVDAQRVLGRVLHTLGRRDEAERAYETALALDPDDAWSNNNLGLLRIEAERFDEAVAPLQRACAVGAGQAVFFNNLGVALERTGEYRAAEQAYAHAVELSPGDAKATVSLARVSGLRESGPGTGVLADTAPAPSDSSSVDEMALASPEVGVTPEP